MKHKYRIITHWHTRDDSLFIEVHRGKRGFPYWVNEVKIYESAFFSLGQDPTDALDRLYKKGYEVINKDKSSEKKIINKKKFAKKWIRKQEKIPLKNRLMSNKLENFDKKPERVKDNTAQQFADNFDKQIIDSIRNLSKKQQEQIDAKYCITGSRNES